MNKVCKLITKDKTKTILFTLGVLILIAGIVLLVVITDSPKVSGLGAAKIVFGGFLSGQGVSRNGLKDRQLKQDQFNKKQEEFNKDIKKDISDIKDTLYQIQKDNIRYEKKFLEIRQKDYLTEKKINKLCKGKK